MPWGKYGYHSHFIQEEEADGVEAPVITRLGSGNAGRGSQAVWLAVNIYLIVS